MTLWDAPIHLVDLVLIGGLLLIGVASGVASGVSGVSSQSSPSPSPLPVSDTCVLIPGRFGAPGRYSCRASPVSPVATE